MCFHAAIVRFPVIGNLSVFSACFACVGLPLALHPLLLPGFSTRRRAFSFPQFTSCVFGTYVVVRVK